MSNSHLNLFNSYQQSVIENNVTRALAVTLSRLSPVHQRLALKQLFLPSDRAEAFEVLKGGPLQFDLQVHAPESDGSGEEDLLTAENGVLVGLHHADHETDIDVTDVSDLEGASRIDALIEDPGNDLSVLIEVKLGATFSQRQLARHHKRFFDTDLASFSEVFHPVRWTDVIGFFDDFARNNLRSSERWILDEFVDFADIAGVSPFLGYKASDFQEQNERTLHRFVTAVHRNVETEPSLEPHGQLKRLDFEGIDPNLWVDYRGDQLELGLVCGVEKKRYARQYRDAFVEEPDSARGIFETLADRGSEIDSEIEVVLHPRARLFGTRVQTTTVRIGDPLRMPEKFSDARKLLADEKLNPIDRISRAEVTDRFKDWLDQYEDKFGPDGLFMPWQELDEKGILTTLYFHTGYQVPSSKLVEINRPDTLDFVEPLLQELASAAEKLSALRAKQ